MNSISNINSIDSVNDINGINNMNGIDGINGVNMYDMLRIHWQGYDFIGFEEKMDAKVTRGLPGTIF